MGWLALWLLVVFVGMTGAIVCLNSLRFERRVSRDAMQMWIHTGASTSFQDGQRSDRLEKLPAPVRRYLRKALGDTPSVRSVRIAQRGSFRTSLDGKWFPLVSHQYFRADPPAFVWWGRIRIAPGIWVDAHDRSVGGVANMFVSAASTIALANRSGPALDESALQRLLGELFWLPSALASEYVVWTAIDDHHARATLRAGEREATGIFTFDENDLPVQFSANRYRDLGNGKSALTPFTGDCEDFRTVSGMLVPHRVTGTWHVDDRPLPFIRLEVDRLEYDKPTPF